MPRHRHLSLSTFVKAVPFNLFQAYFDQIKADQKPSAWAFLNPQAMENFLYAPENAQTAGGVFEDFKRINDICGHGMSLLLRAYNRYGLEFDKDKSAQELAMQLFVDAREAFEFAWSRYLFFGSPGKLSRHHFAVPTLSISDDGLGRFKASVQSWFADLAKGSVCQVHAFEDEGEAIVRISRGSYLRTVACWEGEDIAFQTYRPASEDLIVYDPVTSTLSIKASLEKEREEYLRLFATHIAGNPALAEVASRERVFSLAPLQNGRFDYAGYGPVSRIDLTKVRLKLRSPGNTIIEVKADDVRQALIDGGWGLSLQSGELILARFRFHLHPEGEGPKTVTFDIEPPARTDLTQKRYADIIEAYLAEQDVKLL